MKIAKRLKKDNYLVFLDIDNLKEVNDAYGHAVGDLLLQGVGGDPPEAPFGSPTSSAASAGTSSPSWPCARKAWASAALLARIEEGVQAFRIKDYPRLAPVRQHGPRPRRSPEIPAARRFPGPRRFPDVSGEKTEGTARNGTVTSLEPAEKIEK